MTTPTEHRMTIRLPMDSYRKLLEMVFTRRAAGNTGITLNGLVVQAVTQYLVRHGQPIDPERR